MSYNRRSVLQGIGAMGATLAFSGLASAANGSTRFIARVTNRGTERLERAGYTVHSSLAGGDIVLLSGDGTPEDIAAVRGVKTAAYDFEFELESPAVTADVDVAMDDDFYDEYLWDKQIQEVKEAHEYATGTGRQIAVIDTGIDDTHPDLTVDTDASVSIIDGDFGEHTGDVGDHGTHVAGTVAGNGTLGMLGTAPDATLLSVRIFDDDGGAAFGDVLLGMEYAASVGADAANMSLGTPPIPPQENAAQYRRFMESVANGVTKEGTVLVGSAGNSDTSLQQGGLFTLPNSLAGVVSVSASAPNDERAFYSNYGTNEVTVGAPGGGYETEAKTLSEDPAEVEWPFPLNLVFSTIPLDDGGYGWKAGTSMAAPQVAGLVALVRELEPTTNARQVTNAIAHGGQGANGRSDDEFGAGRTNALETVRRLS
ncbi:S8 family peptidase [Natronosalvus amylolyticus]|uniref:S8 family peptidase n=1 Tax=Natronosalvus amylolyticus TaxID=2961994 RepID=UPI0020C950DA|nr:S8 family serine peptidase [Natronosalvus amylolyticus]